MLEYLQIKDLLEEMKDSKDEGYIKGMPKRQAINYGVGLRSTFYKDISMWELSLIHI